MPNCLVELTYLSFLQSGLLFTHKGLPSIFHSRPYVCSLLLSNQGAIPMLELSSTTPVRGFTSPLVFPVMETP